ncbi:hypothetical protein F2P81_021631 [Scophthalmus maximus]|uniref:Uncharacterized protein n=1 Tax=Scophthalmus maximus TaxID=52904 RepID=A0A6A4S8E7_SCOMX|nr:hypothetical protein F2P81_021631 [Scophthalmus maximus]
MKRLAMFIISSTGRLSRHRDESETENVSISTRKLDADADKRLDPESFVRLDGVQDCGASVELTSFHSNCFIVSSSSSDQIKLGEKRFKNPSLSSIGTVLSGRFKLSHGANSFSHVCLDDARARASDTVPPPRRGRGRGRNTR